VSDLYERLGDLLSTAGTFKIDLGDMTPEKRSKLKDALTEERSRIASGTELLTATLALLDSVLEEL